MDAVDAITEQNEKNSLVGEDEASAYGHNMKSGAESAVRKEMDKVKSDGISTTEPFTSKLVHTPRIFPEGLTASLDWQSDKFDSSVTRNEDGSFSAMLHWAAVPYEEVCPDGETRDGIRNYIFVILAVGKKGGTMNSLSKKSPKKSRTAKLAERKKMLADKKKSK